MLSKKALILINLVFGKKSNIQFPAATASEIVEIKEWVKEKIEETEKEERIKNPRPTEQVKNKPK